MKRTPLHRKTPMERKPPPRKALPDRPSRPSRPEKPRSKAPPSPRRAEPSMGRRTRREWQAAKAGRCALCPSRQGLHIHHVVYEQHVRREGGDIYDPRNGMTLCFKHHFEHHNAYNRRIDRARLPAAAIEFAVELMGADRAELYLSRYYSTTEGGGT